MRSAILAAAFLAAPALAADDKPAVKEISTKGLKLAFPKPPGKPTEPTVIKTADELAKCPVCGGEADAIKKQVDFSKEKLLVFAWGGSGGDKLAADEKTPGTFTLKRGLTRDYRMHMHLFAVPKDAEVKVVAAR